MERLLPTNGRKQFPQSSINCIPKGKRERGRPGDAGRINEAETSNTYPNNGLKNIF